MAGLVAIVALLAQAPPGGLAAAAPGASEAVRAFVAVVAARGSPHLAVDFDAYAGEGRGELPIGVFDSGIGGLTVLDELRRVDAFDNRTHAPGADGVPDFAAERFVYLADQANMPYGNYPREGNEALLRRLVLEDAVFLLGRRYWPAPDAPAARADKRPVKALVVACNTATAYGLADLRAALAAWGLPVPVVGVLEAGARGAVDEEARAGRAGAGTVAVFATAATCQSGAYPRAISAAARAAGAPPPAVVQHGSVDLAAAIEGGLGVGAIIERDVAALLDAQRRAGTDRPLTTVVLGCTHYPLVRDRIAAALARGTGGGAAAAPVLVDPARHTAVELYGVLARQGLLRRPGSVAGGGAGGDGAFYVSVPNRAAPGVRLDRSGAFEPRFKFGRPADRFDTEWTRRVPLRSRQLAPALRALIERRMPVVWRRMRAFEAPPAPAPARPRPATVPDGR
jgi:glutamate racemase